MKQRKRIATIFFVVIALAGCSVSQTTTPFGADIDQMLSDIAGVPAEDEIAASIKGGIGAIRDGSYREAGDHFAGGLRLDPTNGNLHFLNGLSYHLRSRSGDQSMLEFAEAGYALALRFDPDNYWASYFLGHVYFQQDRFEDAQNQFSYALLYEPAEPDFLRALAAASYYARSLDLAHWAAERVVQIDPENPASWRTAFFARAAGGDAAGAQSSLKNYQTLLYEGGGSTNNVLQDWSVRSIERRADDWKDYHAQRLQLAQERVVRGGSVFGSGSQAEGTPLDLDSETDSYDGDDSAQSDFSGSDAPTPTKAPPGTSGKDARDLPNMALVDVVIIRTEESRSQSKGINLLEGIQATLTGTLFAYNRVTGDNNDGSGNLVGADAETRTIAPTLALSGLEYNLNIFNDGVNKAEVLARPSLLAVENQPSKFYSGAILHVQLNSVNADGSLVDVPVGIHLNVTPTFLDDETVRIKVHAERNFIETRDEKLGFTAFSQTSKTSVDSTAVLKFGQTLILSGLTENEENKEKSGVPFLKSVPGVQYFFSRKTEEEIKTSVLILLSPHKARYAEDHLTPREAKKAERERKKGTAHTTALKEKEGIAKKDNLDAVFETMDHHRYYREFQVGDLRLSEWKNPDSLFNALRRALGFLWY